jgi:tRNA-specific 2-thiouridylase
MESIVKCVVGLSGGVDSSSVAAILKSKGYEVIGCTLKMFESPKSHAAIVNARKVADYLGIQHKVLDCVADFRKYVTDYFVNSYLDGFTPNPCIMCNTHVKFQFINAFRKQNDADFLATGHYVRLRVTDEHQLELRQAADIRKDQSYFLYAVDRDILSCAIFPLGEYKKTETRAMAREFGLHVAESSESQDICFVANNDYVSYIKNYGIEVPQCPCNCDDGGCHCHRTQSAGHIVDKNGTILGNHNGIFNYTIGQRKGLGLSGGPFFVCGLNVEKNEVIVTDKEGVRANLIVLRSVKFINRKFSGNCFVQIRSTNSKIKAKLLNHEAANGDAGATGTNSLSTSSDASNIAANQYFVELCEPEYGVAKGQHCVFYDADNIVLGGGIIS